MDDRVDSIIREWHERRPKLDFSPLEVVARVIRVSHFLQARLDGIAEAYGLSHTGDLDVLTDLDRAGPPHQRTPSELAETLLLTTGGMTVRLNRLQRAGLIERLPNPLDGRGVLVRLTPIGKGIGRRRPDHTSRYPSGQPWNAPSVRAGRPGRSAPNPPPRSRRHPGISTRHRGATRTKLDRSDKRIREHGSSSVSVDDQTGRNASNNRISHVPTRPVSRTLRRAGRSSCDDRPRGPRRSSRLGCHIPLGSHPLST